jgi:hypothetical protein
MIHALNEEDAPIYGLTTLNNELYVIIGTKESQSTTLRRTVFNALYEYLVLAESMT